MSIDTYCQKKLFKKWISLQILVLHNEYCEFRGLYIHMTTNGQKPVGGYIFCVLSCTPGAKCIDFQYVGLRDDTHIPADYPRDNHKISVQKNINHSLKTLYQLTQYCHKTSGICSYTMWRFNTSFFRFWFRSSFPVGLNILTHTACCRVHSGTEYVYVISLDLFMDQDWIQAGHCILGDLSIRIKCCHSHRIIPGYKHELNPLCTKLSHSKPYPN